MPDLDFLSAAYQNGEVLGRAFRWMMLLAIALSVVVGVARGTFGRSRLRRVAGTVVGVVVCLVGSLHYDYFGGHARAEPGRDMSAAREEVMLGCLDQGQPKSVCECYGDEVLRRVDHSGERFAVLEREMVRRRERRPGTARADHAGRPGLRRPRRLGVVPRRVVHPGPLGGWRCSSHQFQGGHRMKLHANAALSLNQRRRMVGRVLEQGWSLTKAAEAAEVSDRTCSKWVARYRAQGEARAA